jgi:pSer/pThr/pTyr-binding forkhead associated (FHA) protein
MQKSTVKSGTPASGQFELKVAGDKCAAFHVSAPGVEGYIIGRSDSKSSYRPDIDLVDCNALEKGVSRRHAAFVRYNNNITIVDLGSVNGTFLNGERLEADVPHSFNPGDDLRLGTLGIALVKLK